jgi:hypothetical protein
MAHPSDMTRSPAPKVRVVKAARGVLSLAIDHDDQAAGWALFRASLGGHSGQLTDMMVTQLAELSRQGGEIAEPALNNNLGIVRGIAPRDTAELLLAMQMAAVHGATMATARRLNGDKTPARQDSLFNALNKLARTYAMQVETLKRYRNGVQRPDPEPAGPDDSGPMTIIRTIIREPPLGDQNKSNESKLSEAALGEAGSRSASPKGVAGARSEAAALPPRAALTDQAGEGQMGPRVKPADDGGGVELGIGPLVKRADNRAGGVMGTEEGGGGSRNLQQTRRWRPITNRSPVIHGLDPWTHERLPPDHGWREITTPAVSQFQGSFGDHHDRKDAGERHAWQPPMRGSDPRRWRPLPLPGRGRQAPLPPAWRIGRFGGTQGKPQCPEIRRPHETGDRGPPGPP